MLMCCMRFRPGDGRILAPPPVWRRKWGRESQRPKALYITLKTKLGLTSGPQDLRIPGYHAVTPALWCARRRPSVHGDPLRPLPPAPLAAPPASSSVDCSQTAWPRFVTALASSHGTPAQATSCPTKGRPAPAPTLQWPLRLCAWRGGGRGKRNRWTGGSTLTKIY